MSTAISTPVRTRIAPTPSGYLHLGNLANFLLVEKLARTSAGTVILRIDDCDSTRARPEFVRDIFATLGWLGIEWREGPRDEQDFARSFSQAARKEYYFDRLRALAPHTYACACSRKEAGAVYGGHCRDKGIQFRPGEHALRLRIDDPALATRFGDVVLWRKDGGPAYQWVSVIDDLDQRVNLIVRGQDLADSSDLQKHIAALVVPGGFAGVRFVHHPLLKDPNGEKLAKSQRAPALKDFRDTGISAAELRARVDALIRDWPTG